MCLPASTLNVLDYYYIPWYSDSYQTVPNYSRIVLGTGTPNPATCFRHSPRTRAGSQAPALCSGQGGSCGGRAQAQPPVPRDAARFSFPFNSPSDSRRPSPGDPIRHLPRLAAGEGSRGQTGPAPRHAYFLPPACVDANSGIHKTGLHQTDQPPSSPRYYPRHKPWQKAAAKASPDRLNNSGDKGLFCLRRWHKSDAITPARLQPAPYLFI